MESTQMKPAELLEQVNKAIAAVLVGRQPVPDAGGPVHAESHAG